MIESKNYLNDLEIINSGSIWTSEKDVYKIIMEDMIFEFHFLRDTNETDVDKLDYSVADKTLTLKLTNYSNPNGTGLTNPWEIGTLLNRALYLSFMVKFQTGSLNSLYTLDYIFYLGKEVENAR